MVILNSNVLTESEYQDYLLRKKKVANLLKKENYKKNSLETGMSEKKVRRHFAKSMAKFKNKTSKKNILKSDIKKLKYIKSIISKSQNIDKNINTLKHYAKINLNKIKNNVIVNNNYSDLREKKFHIFPNTKCWICKKEKANCMHHIILLKNGGSNNLKNLIPICNTCHEKIHSWMLIKKQNEEIDRQFYEAIK